VILFLEELVNKKNKRTLEHLLGELYDAQDKVMRSNKKAYKAEQSALAFRQATQDALEERSRINKRIISFVDSIT
jgi:hypothetical protein